MRWGLITILSFFFLASLASASPSGTCSIIVSENGRAFTLLSMVGNGTINIPIPIDVPYPELEGAIYVQSNDGVEVSMSPEDKAVLAYKSSLMTNKEGGEWSFGYSTPALESLELTVSLPRNARIIEISPSNPAITTGNTTEIKWNLEKKAIIGIKYSYTDAEPIQLNIPVEEPSINKQLMTNIAIYAAVMIILFFSGLVLGRFLNKPGSGRLKQTVSMKNLMDTLSENEFEVVDLLLKNNGSMRRTEVARATEMAKSSLAAVINNLERKNVIEVDRRFTIHVIKLREVFLKR